MPQAEPRNPTTPDSPGELPNDPSEPNSPPGPNDIPEDAPPDERRHKDDAEASERDEAAAAAEITGLAI